MVSPSTDVLACSLDMIKFDKHHHDTLYCGCSARCSLEFWANIILLHAFDRQCMPLVHIASRIRATLLCIMPSNLFLDQHNFQAENITRHQQLDVPPTHLRFSHSFEILLRVCLEFFICPWHLGHKVKLQHQIIFGNVAQRTVVWNYSEVYEVTHVRPHC